MFYHTLWDYRQFAQYHRPLIRRLGQLAREHNRRDDFIEATITELILEPCRDRFAHWNAVLTQQEKSLLSPLVDPDFLKVVNWYKLGDYPHETLAEPTVGGLTHKGEEVALITENAYGCKVLNAFNMAIADIDINPENWSDFPDDLSLECATVPSVEDAVRNLRQLASVRPGWGGRLYRTKNGLRFIVTTHEYEATADTTQLLLVSAKADPLYIRLCGVQNTFRARLNPKPWRIKEDTESHYAVCHLHSIIGEDKIIEPFQQMITLHDESTRALNLKMPLA